MCKGDGVLGKKSNNYKDRVSVCVYLFCSNLTEFKCSLRKFKQQLIQFQIKLIPLHLVVLSSISKLIGDTREEATRMIIRVTKQHLHVKELKEL